MKQQSAVEFLTVYSFALITLTFMLTISFLISSSVTPQTTLYSQCNIEPLMPCEEALISYNAVGFSTYTLLFRSDINYVLYFPQNALNLTTTGVGVPGTLHTFGNCYPQYASLYTQVICIANVPGATHPSYGDDVDSPFSLTYNLCNSYLPGSCQSGNYLTTGYSIESLSPAYTKLYLLGLQSYNGIILLNGAPYPGGSQLYLVSGNYIVYAKPNSGYYFEKWSVSSGTSNVVPSSAQNAILVLNSNSNVVATFG